MITWLKSLFRKDHSNAELQDENADRKYLEGLDYFHEAKEKYLAKNYEAALPLFDASISCGIIEAYGQRAFCLQALEYHLDALDDFEQAIMLELADCNLYSSRCWSYLAVGENQAAIDSINKAVELSKVKNSLNAINDAAAKSQGYSGITDMMALQQDGINTMARLRLPVKPQNLLRRSKN